ncbi:hypothetical protein ACD591_01010 [Rufibacter glacialis]|uniref:Uncharacterized protein n=1 Tax=Rufibacter glacialis TaxID=1259555 RepID=A0A5M8QKF9_9BACT|nr:hypothetical protein [Rufibacter glacialis]KAA6435480.1 hypothetical protein FOE74_05920 [Rufibacter glacialis]GGK63842.1 hypothetical protein GCM10011405_09830 [Rufibacter glacialis]
MQYLDAVENITPQRQLPGEVLKSFLTPEQMIQLAYARLAYLKALYRKQLGFEGEEYTQKRR